MFGPKVVEMNVAHYQTPTGEIHAARDAREMKMIQGNWWAKNKRNGAEDMMQGGQAANDTIRGRSRGCGATEG